jgi:hypothetical protein
MRTQTPERLGTPGVARLSCVCRVTMGLPVSADHDDAIGKAGYRLLRDRSLTKPKGGSVMAPERESGRTPSFGIGLATFGLAVFLAGAALADEPFRYSGSEISEILRELPFAGSVRVSDLLTADDVTKVCLFANDMHSYDFEEEGCVVNRDSLIVVQETGECSFVPLDGIRVLLSNPETECRDMSATLELLYITWLKDGSRLEKPSENTVEIYSATIVLSEPEDW